MIKAEWKYITSHKLTLAILLVIMLIPMLYTTIFLSSMWNPYKKVDNLPIAIVNKDIPVNVQGQKLAVGDQLVHQLKKTDSMDYHFVSSEKRAQQKLKNGQYYMVVTIPRNFSKHAATAFTDQPQKMRLHYETNLGSSYVAGKMMTSAAKQLANTISASMTKQYLTIMAKQLQLMQSSPMASQQTGGLTLTDKTIDQIAQPIKLIHSDKSHTPNNGTGMAPYMMSVALYVGCLTLNLMYDIITPRKYPRTGIGWWAAKISVVGTFAILQAVVAYVAMIKWLGLDPVHPWATLAVVMVTSLAFSNFVTMLNVAFGKVGSFLSLIVLILQLGGAEGTYPLELSSHFFQTIHPYLPATYSVHGLKESLMIGGTATTDIYVLLAIFACSAVLLMVLYKFRLRSLPAIDYEKLSK